MVSGQLIALEGPKLAGKTTLIAALARRLATAPGVGVVLTKEPTPAFDLIREERMHGVELAAAIADDRRRHITEVIGPALADGHTVVCDRYILSSYIFHTADGVPEAVIEELNHGFPRPMLNLVLQVQTRELHRRRIQRATTTRLQSDDAQVEAAAYLRYAEHMELQGVPSRIVDNSTMTDHRTLLNWLCARCVGEPQ